MKIITLVIALICLSQAALADGLSTPTPSPSPAYVNPLGRRGGIRRTERAERRETYQSAANSRAQTRGQRKADRAAAGTQAQAARAREQAQREVAAENRRETRDEKPHLTSDLMSRMGFSAQEVAEQKAREQSANAESKKTSESASPSR